MKIPARSTCLCSVVVALLGALAASASAQPCQPALPITYNPSSLAGLLFDPKYHAMDDNLEAASRLRRDALARGFELTTRLDWKVAPPNGAMNDSMTVQYFLQWARVCISDRSHEDHLSTLRASPDSATLVTALVYLPNNCSVGEVAGMLEGGVRIMAARGNGVFVVAARVRDLAKFAATDLCRWIGEYSAERKAGSPYFESPTNMYNVKGFWTICPRFEDDLRRLSLSVVGAVGEYASIAGAWRDVQAARDLWWVECVFTESVEVND